MHHVPQLVANCVRVQSVFRGFSPKTAVCCGRLTECEQWTNPSSLYSVWQYCNNLKLVPLAAPRGSCQVEYKSSQVDENISQNPNFLIGVYRHGLFHNGWQPCLGSAVIMQLGTHNRILWRPERIITTCCVSL